MPSVSDIQKFMETIPSKLNDFTYEQIVEMCNYYFPRIPFPMVEFTNDPFCFGQKEFGGLNVIFRGREITNAYDEPHDSISEISYIQEKDLDKIKYFGRANKPRNSMFYGSLNFATTCIETLSKGELLKNGEPAMVTIGMWVFKAPLKLVQMPYSEKYWKLFYETVSFKSEKLTAEHIRAENFEMRKKIGSDFYYDILQFFGDAFARFDIDKHTDYMLSNYYADRIFNQIEGRYTNENYDGIIYPSIPNSYQELNIVLKPETINTKLKFGHAMQVWVVSHFKTGGGVQFIPIRTKVKADENGKLLWK